ncbi:hypothetical protein [Leisingera sp. JC11]|uniref:hypothetical protein n=1 Tax=Leisingera sp. JC11 TaxID=3042469 RepID=UPI003452294B
MAAETAVGRHSVNGRIVPQRGIAYYEMLHLIADGRSGDFTPQRFHDGECLDWADTLLSSPTFEQLYRDFGYVCFMPAGLTACPAPILLVPN